ncbi:MAG TPA: FAD-dependent oxidoreductase [Spirochaetota bacterium]|nr:FAD-dependent oxidoreductase [Spirochaetota bacterium]
MKHGMAGNLLEALSDNIVVDRDKCMGCGVCVERCPMDNLRLKSAPCTAACPLGVNAQGYVRLIALGDEEEAYRILKETLPFPGILGRICSRPCEMACAHNEHASPRIAIRALKRYLADRFADHAEPATFSSPSGKSVAIIGSGPAGLMAAHDLRLHGHEVVVLEAESAPGGMLRWAIPVFRLPREVLEKEISRLTEMGVRFGLGERIDAEGRTRLLDEFDAVLVASGGGPIRRLGVPGEGLSGVRHALSFLRAARTGSLPGVGERAVVIGGGNAALDAAQTALRCGAKEVSIVCLEARCEMPAFPWALDEALSEGVRLVDAWGPIRFIGEEGKLTGIVLQRCTGLFDDTGDFSPRMDACQTMTFEADTVIIAAGQEMNDMNIGGGVDPLTLQVNGSSLFIAGDAATGPSSVVHAMASGRRAAESIHRLLAGEPLGLGRTVPTDEGVDAPVRPPTRIDTNARRPRMRSFKGKGDCGEVESAFDADMARAEASRCLSCGVAFGRYRTCWFCLPCEIECPQKAINVEIPYLLR